MQRGRAAARGRAGRGARARTFAGAQLTPPSGRRDPLAPGQAAPGGVDPDLRVPPSPSAGEEAGAARGPGGGGGAGGAGGAPSSGRATMFSPPGQGADLDDVLEVPTLWGSTEPVPSPFVQGNNKQLGFVSNLDRVALQSLVHGTSDSIGSTCAGAAIYDPQDDVCIPIAPWAYRSGARQDIYFEPREVKAAIVTCGGLCPGLNDVVRGLVIALHSYGVEEDNVLGVRYGYRGFYSEDFPPITLTRSHVAGIQRRGGTILGTSRGGADMPRIVEKIEEMGINMVYVVGGNGGNAGASEISRLCIEQGLKCAVVGVPKSIDNDILVIDRTFGFDTAVEEAVKAINAAYVEASSAYRGVGLVKLMGRQSGFIALHASISSGEADVCLIPEQKFKMKGENGLFNHVESVLATKGHAVIVVAEGAAQDILAAGSTEKDASGNPILGDVGAFMKREIQKHFSGEKRVDLKYIDPTYMIRATETNPSDKMYCQVLAQGAVHGAFAGFTGITVGVVNNHAAYLPIELVVSAPRVVDTRGKTWERLIDANGQPLFQDSAESSR